MRFGVLGGGYWGKNIIRNLLKMPGVEVALICDPHRGTREEIARDFGLKVTGEPDAVLEAPGIDAVLIVTPPSLHYLPAKKALLAGKHVFVEKPMAMDYAQGEELLTLSERQGKVLFVDETFLYDPALRLVKELVQGEAIGPVRHVLSERLGMGRIRCESNVWWNSAPHDLSIIRFILPGKVTSITVKGNAFIQDGLEDVAMGLLELQGGVTCFVHLSWCHPHSTASLTVVGEKGAIFYEGRFKKRKVILYRYQFGEKPRDIVWGIPSPNLIPAQATEERTWTDFGPTEPLYASLEAFLRAIKEGFEAPSLGKYSLETLRVLDAGHRSLKEGGIRVQV